MAKRVPKFTYNGDYKTNSDDTYWYIHLFSSGTLTFVNDRSSFDIFIVGGGAGGNGGTNIYGGAGGCSGKTSTKNGLSATAGQAFEITVGKGGAGGVAHGFATAGGKTIAFGSTADGGTVDTSGFTSQPGASVGGSGSGTGAYKNLSWAAGKGGADGANGTSPGGQWAAGKGQGTTTRAFGETDGALYASGGDGGAFDSLSGASGEDAVQNTGDGGNGGLGGSSAYYAGGDGADGVVIIRGTEEDVLPVFYDNTQLGDLFFNGTQITSLIYNGTKLFCEKLKRRVIEWYTSMKTARCLKMSI